MRLNRSMRYLFMMRDPDGSEFIAMREWKRGRWETWPWPRDQYAGYGSWRVCLSKLPLWRGGPRMVLEVPA